MKCCYPFPLAVPDAIHIGTSYMCGLCCTRYTWNGKAWATTPYRARKKTAA